MRAQGRHPEGILGQGGNLQTDLGKRDSILGEHRGATGNDQAHSERRHQYWEPGKAIAGGMIDRDGETRDDEAHDGGEVERDSALGEQRATFVSSDLIRIARRIRPFREFSHAIDDACEPRKARLR